MKYVAILILIFFLTNCQIKSKEYIFNEGYIYGTIYHLTYESPKGIDFQDQIDSLLHCLDLSLSTFKPKSILSKVNQNEKVRLDKYFLDVYHRSAEIYQLSEGAFDPTVAPLVNIWGFGFKHKEKVTQLKIDSILAFTGFHMLTFEQGEIRKADPRIMLDFSSIAKGYTVDVVADYLKSKGCSNYMVEIGGEIVASGVNKAGRVWRIGINEPNDNEPMNAPELQEIISINNVGLATSGNYRNFYVENGKKYAHTIHPATGFPVQHNLLSATVIAENCMTADALATAFMVLGTDKAIELATRIEKVEAYLIYDDKTGERAVAQTPGFKNYIAN